MPRRFELSFTCDNDAFWMDTIFEIKRVLKLVRWMVSNNSALREGLPAVKPILDGNGNRIGGWAYSSMPDEIEVVGVVALWRGEGHPPAPWRWMFRQDEGAPVRYITRLDSGP